ncbi:hypothetical protein [Streptomyces sp. NPDC058157]|uniref:hypothetical protein n=1 Tax=Streptomyces sp. NPDC058157 TaxID=3346360 RepID=UPI0036F14769
MSDTNRQDDWQAGVLGELTGTGPATTPAPPGTPDRAPARAYPAHGGQAAPAGPGQGQWPGDPARAYPAHGLDPAHAALPHQSPARADWPGDPAQASPAQAYPAPDGHAAPVGPARGPWPADGGQGGVAQEPGRPYAQPQAAYQPQPHTARRAAPETVPVLGAGAPVGRPRHGDPLMRRTLRTLRGALGSSAAKAVTAETGLATQVQQPVTTGRQIVVTSIRGGSGKTTVTALLSRTYNHFRHDPVLTLEADAALGTLPVRLGVESLRWTCGDLAQIVRPSMQLTDITGYLVPLPDGGWLLPGSQGRIGAQVDVATYRTVMVALRRYFGVTVVDCETLPGEVARTALDTAHARVLTTPATAEGLVSTHAVLDWLATLPVPVLPRTVVVLTVQSPHPAVDLAKATEKLAATGAGVVVLPYDRHLASGGSVRTELLGEGTRQAAVRLAAEVLQRAVALPVAGGAR